MGSFDLQLWARIVAMNRRSSDSVVEACSTTRFMESLPSLLNLCDHSRTTG